MMLEIIGEPWVMINIAASVIAACAGAYMLIAYSDEISQIERFGVGAICGGSLLTIGPIITAHTYTTSPFDDWSGSLLRIGCALAFVGWMWRRDHTRWRIWWSDLIHWRAH